MMKTQKLFLYLITASSTLSQAAPTFEEIFHKIESEAAQKSPDIRQAEANYEQASGHNYVAWTRWAPRLNLQLSKSRSKDYSLLTSGSLPLDFGFPMDPQQTDLVRWQLIGTFPIYNRATHLGATQALWEKRLAEQQFELRKQELHWKLKQLVGNYIVAAYREAVSRNGIETARESAREMRVRFEIGQKTKIDVLRAESNLATLESRWITSQQQASTERYSLADGSGMTPQELAAMGLDEKPMNEEQLAGWIEALGQNSAKELTHLTPYLETAPDKRAQKAIEASPYYASLYSQGRVSSVRSGLAFAAEWPELTLQATLGKQTPQWKEAWESGMRSYSMGVTLSLPIFSWGSSVASYRESSAAHESARIQNARDTQKFFNDLESQTLQIKSLSKAIEANSLRMQQDQEIVRLSMKSNQLGKTSTVDLLSAQNDLLSAKVELAESRVRLAVLLGQLAWNLGVTPE